jgi:hypothetical protein
MNNIHKHNNFTSGVISAENKNVVKTKPNLYQNRNRLGTRGSVVG